MGGKVAFLSLKPLSQFYLAPPFLFKSILVIFTLVLHSLTEKPT